MSCLKKRILVPQPVNHTYRGKGSKERTRGLKTKIYLTGKQTPWMNIHQWIRMEMLRKGEWRSFCRGGQLRKTILQTNVRVRRFRKRMEAGKRDGCCGLTHFRRGWEGPRTKKPESIFQQPKIWLLIEHATSFSIRQLRKTQLIRYETPPDCYTL